MKMRSQTIAGHKLSLEVGIQYLAARPMADVGMEVYPVTTTDLDNYIAVTTIEDLTYEQANKLINKFNNGTISFSGRVW